MRATRRETRRAGFTLWELTMVLAIMAISALLAAPAFARFGTEQPTRGADTFLALLRASRKAAFDYNAVVTLRLDPKTLKYRVDTSTTAGSGTLAESTLDLGLSETLVTDQPRLMYVFRPTGAAFADTVSVQGGPTRLIVRVDQWSGVARADTL